MTVSLEKIFFTWILNNKKFFELVDPFFFKNKEIQFVYLTIRKYMISDISLDIPSPKQIWEMVKLDDKVDMITKDILKNILSTNLDEFDHKNFIEPRFNAWVHINRTKSGIVDIVDITRDLDNISDFDKAQEQIGRIKGIIDSVTSTSFIKDDEDLGSDFDSPEDHSQETSKFKVKSGFTTIDHMLGGGWDCGNFICIMGETNQGKCFSYDGDIKIRKIGDVSGFGVEENIKIGKLFSLIRKRE